MSSSFALPAGLRAAASTVGGGRGLFLSTTTTSRRRSGNPTPNNPLPAGAAVLQIAPYVPGEGACAPRPEHGDAVCARCLRWHTPEHARARSPDGRVFCGRECLRAAAREFLWPDALDRSSSLLADARRRLERHCEARGSVYPLVALRLAASAVLSGGGPSRRFKALLQPLCYANLGAGARAALREEHAAFFTAALPSAVRGDFGAEWYEGVMARLHLNAFKVQPPNLADLASAAASGSAALPAAAMLQHSCAPNLALMFPEADARFEFVAARPLEDGEELFVSYVDETLPVRERRRALRRGYGFECRCEACVADLREEGGA